MPTQYSGKSIEETSRYLSKFLNRNLLYFSREGLETLQDSSHSVNSLFVNLSRILALSMADNSPSEVHFKVVLRCRGEFFLIVTTPHFSSELLRSE